MRVHADDWLIHYSKQATDITTHTRYLHPLTLCGTQSTPRHQTILKWLRITAQITAGNTNYTLILLIILSFVLASAAQGSVEWSDWEWSPPLHMFLISHHLIKLHSSSYKYGRSMLMNKLSSHIKSELNKYTKSIFIGLRWHSFIQRLINKEFANG